MISNQLYYITIKWFTERLSLSHEQTRHSKVFNSDIYKGYERLIFEELQIPFYISHLML